MHAARPGRLIPRTIVSGSVYAIRPFPFSAEDKVVTLTDDGSFSVERYTGSRSQRWRFEDIPGGWTIRSLDDHSYIGRNASRTKIKPTNNALTWDITAISSKPVYMIVIDTSDDDRPINWSNDDPGLEFSSSDRKNADAWNTFHICSE